MSLVCGLCRYNLAYFYFFSALFMVNFSFSSFIFRLIYFLFLAETNRTPFDFAEGESELVSCFNVECGGGGFALIFFFGSVCKNSFYKFVVFYYFCFIYVL